MNSEQILLNKWRTLPLKKQQEVLDLVEQLYRQNQEDVYQPKTEMGHFSYQLSVPLLEV